MAVPPKYHRHFVSRKGEVLQSIVSECGGFDHVTISFPRTDIKDSKVLLKGSKEAVLSAKSKILDIVKELVSVVWQLIVEFLRIERRLKCS